MILINDEKRGKFIDIELMRTKVADVIERLLKDADNQNLRPFRRDAAVNTLLDFQDQLRDLDEIAKVPFDVLVIVEDKDKEWEMAKREATAPPPSPSSHTSSSASPR